MSTQLQKNDLRSYLHRENALERIKSALGESKSSEASNYIASVLATVANSPALQNCTPESIFLAAYDAATLGLPVNKLGLAWLVPYSGKAQLQIGYRGYIHLVTQSGYVLDINSDTIHENDHFRYASGSKPFIEHYPLLTNRGSIIGVYALAKLSNGLDKFVVMNKEQIDHVRSKSRASGSSPWQTDYAEMAKKTAIKRLCKLLPYNVPSLEVVERASAIEANNYQDYVPYSNKENMLTNTNPNQINTYIDAKANDLIKNDDQQTEN